MAASPQAKFAHTSDMQALDSSDHSSFVLEILADLISFRSPDEERVVYQREQNEASLLTAMKPNGLGQSV